MQFAASVASHVQHQTIKVYLAGIKHHFLINGWDDVISQSARLHLLLRGIKRKGIHRPPFPPRRRLPVTVDLLQQLKSALRRRLDMPTHDRQMIWGAFTTAFFAFLRSAEFTAPNTDRFDSSSTLLRSDVTPQGDNTYSLTIKYSKTAPFRSGSRLLCSSGHQVCAVKA